MEAASRPQATLVPLLAVGLADVPGGVCITGKDTIIYPVGRCLAAYNPSNIQQCRVAEPVKQVRSITSVAISFNNQYVAAGESMAEDIPPQITIFSTSSLERITSLTGSGAVRYTSVCFSGDDQIILGSSYDDDNKCSVLHLWEWQASPSLSCTGSMSGNVLKASIDPKFPINMVAHTAHQVTMWRRGTQGLKSHDIENIPKDSSVTFIDHCWLPNSRFVVATSSKEIWFMERTVKVGCLKIGMPVLCVVALPDCSLLVATAKGGLQLFSKSDEKSDQYVIMAETKVPESGTSASLDSSVRAMCVGSSGDAVACYVRHGPVYLLHVRLLKSAMFKTGVSASDIVEPLMPAMHDSGIVSASLAVKKDLIVTASRDLTVRVWCYNPLRLVVTHLCHHMPTAVAMDPYGREVVVAYVDCVKYYNVVEGMLVDLGELKWQQAVPTEDGNSLRSLEKCHIAKYSPMGNLIAVACNKDIYIFSTLHKTQEAVLKGHFNTVNDLVWSEDGLYLASSSEGAVFTWTMDGYTKAQENTTKTFSNDAIAVTKDFSTVIIGDNTQGLRLLGTIKSAAAMSRSDSPAPPRPGVDFADVDDDDYETPKRITSSGARRVTIFDSERSKSAMSKSSPANQFPARSNSRGSLFSAASAVTGDVKLSSSPVNGRASLQALGRTLSLGRKHAAEQATPVAISQDLSNGRIQEVPELVARSHFTSILQPSRMGMALCHTPECQILVGTGMLGRLRVCDLPPKRHDRFQEQCPHVTDIQQVLVHSNGNLVFTVDSSGVWMMHVVVPYSRLSKMSATPNRARQVIRSLSMAGNKALMEQAAAAAATAGSSMGPHCTMPDEDCHQVKLTKCAHTVVHAMSRDRQDDQEVISVRSVDMQLLKESLRELKERLTKAANEAEYQLYQKEMEVRRQLEGEITRLKELHAASAAEAASNAAGLAEAKQRLCDLEVQMRQELSEALQQQQAVLESRLADEIERTNKAEHNLSRLKAKFGKKLWEVEDEKKEEQARHHNNVLTLQGTVEATKVEASQAIDAANKEMELQIRLDMELNEQELARNAAATSKAVDAATDKYLELLAKHTLHTGLANKLQKDFDELKVEADSLKVENVRLAEQVSGLADELTAMRAAWAQRDVKQRKQDAEMQDMAFQLQQAQLYTTLATSRIKELNDELEPMRAAKTKANSEVEHLESMQMRNLERQQGVVMENNNLSVRLENALKEVKVLRQEAMQRESYITNFTQQLWRVVHDVPHHEWATLFGRLYEDFTKGKEKTVWSQYLYDQRSQSSSALQAGHKTETETNVEMQELKAKLQHSEKMLALVTETKDKAERNRREVTQKLMADNLQLMTELNECKKQLKLAQDQIDRQGGEIHSLRIGHGMIASSGTATGTPRGTARDIPGSFASAAATMQQASNSSSSGLGHQQGYPQPYAPPLTPVNESDDKEELVSTAAYHHSMMPASSHHGSNATQHTSAEHSELQSVSRSPYDDTSGLPYDKSIDSNSASIPPNSHRMSPSKPSSRFGDTNRSRLSSSMASTSITDNLDMPANGLQRRPSTASNTSGWNTYRHNGQMDPLEGATSPQTVTGDMPAGGWWLSDNMFEVPQNLAIMRGELKSRDGGKRRGSSSQQSSRTLAAAAAANSAAAGVSQASSSSDHKSMDERRGFTPQTPSSPEKASSSRPFIPHLQAAGASTPMHQSASALPSGSVTARASTATATAHTQSSRNRPATAPGSRNTVGSVAAAAPAISSSAVFYGLQGSLKPTSPSKVTTIAAGFRSFVPYRKNSSRGSSGR